MWPIFNVWLSTLESMSLWAPVVTHATARLVCIANKNTWNENGRQTNRKAKSSHLHWTTTVLNVEPLFPRSLPYNFLGISYFFTPYTLAIIVFPAKSTYSIQLHCTTNTTIQYLKAHTLKNETIWYIFIYFLSIQTHFVVWQIPINLIIWILKAHSFLIFDPFSSEWMWSDHIASHLIVMSM